MTDIIARLELGRVCICRFVSGNLHIGASIDGNNTGILLSPEAVAKLRAFIDATGEQEATS